MTLEDRQRRRVVGPNDIHKKKGNKKKENQDRLNKRRADCKTYPTTLKPHKKNTNKPKPPKKKR